MYLRMNILALEMLWLCTHDLRCHANKRVDALTCCCSHLWIGDVSTICATVAS